MQNVNTEEHIRLKFREILGVTSDNLFHIAKLIHLYIDPLLC